MIIYLFFFGEVIMLVVGLIVMMCSDGKKRSLPPQQPEIKVDVHVDAPPAQTQYPGIAEQFDGRLTNVLRNPLEGIL